MSVMSDEEYSRRFTMGHKYVQRHLLPLLPDYYSLREAEWGYEYEWAIPTVHAAEAELGAGGDLFYGLPIVCDPTLINPVVRRVACV